MRVLTSSEIYNTTQATLAAFKTLGLKCCFVGSVACACYGMSRTPGDIDIVVFTTEWTQEALKRLLVSTDSSFYTIASKDPLATYRVLWYCLPGYRCSCKVDVLLPGIMNIPDVPSSCIIKRRYPNHPAYIPLMPFVPLFLLKLQAWQDHRESSKFYMQRKEPVDVADITELLNIYAISSTELGMIESWISSAFKEAAIKRIRWFLAKYSHTKKEWRKFIIASKLGSDREIIVGR